KEDKDGDGKLDKVDEDENKNGKLDKEKVTSELNLEDSWEEDESAVHIFTLSDKHIFQANVNALRVDASAGAAHYPALAFEPVHRKFLVAWETREENGFSKIYGQLLFSGGGKYGPNRLLSFQDLDGDGEQDASVAASNQTRPQVVTDVSDQLFFITWQDGRNTQVTQENIDIYGQFVDCEGSLWGTNYPVTIAPGNQYDPITSYNYGSHRFFTVWKDARNLYETNSDVYGRGFDIADVQVFDFGRAATRIVINDIGSNTDITPVTLQFPTVTAGAASVRGINLENLSASALTVQEVTVVGDAFTAGDLVAGDEIDAGDKHLFSVSFAPDHAGRFDSVLTIRLTGTTTGQDTDTGTGTDTGGDLNSGTEELVEISCTIHLSGGARGEYIYYEEDTSTADQLYELKMNTVTDAPGRLYVLLVHDPVSAGEIYTVLPDGTLTLFPYETSSEWQSLFYTSGVPRAREVSLSAIDFRQLGCSSCQWPTLVDGYRFGDFPVQPPITASATNAVDFKYLAGDMYIATYITDDTTSQPFNFNLGLVELLKLKINSLSGSWQVTSSYNGGNRVHADLLQVQEENGNISAQWDRYSPIDISYDETDSAYRIEFSLGAYHYTYMIDQLTADNFSGYYHCEYDGTVVVDQAAVSGVRVQ
ncbi:MAG: hypothetical protein U9P37_05245, partial [Pseudomonadota bacterium]|nr:hypothetical protein [Pseudomonadota bacterium]